MTFKKFCTPLFLGVFFTATQFASAQAPVTPVNEKDHVADSLRKQGIPEADVIPYASYLIKKRHSPSLPSPLMKNISDAPTPTTSSCYNPGFELGNLTNWTGFTGSCCPITATLPGIVPGQHTVMTGSGIDPYSIITQVAPAGGNFSVRLGNDNVGSEAERLRHSFLVTPDNTSFTYQYAVVLQDPAHEPAAQPRFEVKVYDATGNIVPCGYYQVTAAGTIPGFVSIGDIRYKDWTTVGVDLTAYIGQTITIEFATGDCSYGGHFGYAYIDASCEPLKIKKKFCEGDPVATLTAPAGFSSYSWSTGHTTATISINNPIEGDTIYADMTSVTGCPTKLFAVMEKEALPKNLVALGDTLICPGQKVQLSGTGTGGTAYAWNIVPTNSLISSDSATFVTPINTTNYEITYSNACGAVKDTVTVTVKPYTPIVASNSDTICLGTSIPLTATGNTTYIWSPATHLTCDTCANPTANPDTTTIYVVSAYDSLSSCVVSDTVMITVDNSTISVYAGFDKSICAGQTVYLSGSAPGAASHYWSPSTFLTCDTCLFTSGTPDTTTTYMLIGKNNCAIDTSYVTITVYPIPVASAGPTQSACYGDVVQLTGSGGLNYQWTPAIGLSCTTCPNPSLTVTGNTTYYLSVTNAGGCYANTSVNVIMKSTFSSPTANQTICEGNSVVLLATGDTTKPLLWTPAGTLSCSTCATTVASPTSTTTYVVTGTDTSSCKGVDSVKITVNKLPIANAGFDKTICKGSYVYLTGSGGGSYKWIPSTNLSCTTCSNPQASPTGNTIYQLVTTNACGSDTDEVEVFVNQLPDIDAGPDKTVCNGTGTSLNATGAVSYYWTPSTYLSCTYCPNPNLPFVGGTVTYYVKGTDANGCFSWDTIKVNALPKPTIDAGPAKSICIGTGTALNPIGSVSSPVWTPSTGLSCTACTSPTASPTSSTTYTFTVTHPGSGCVASDTVTVQVKLPPTAVGGPDKSICPGKTTTVSALGGTTYSWSPSSSLVCPTCSTSVATPSATTAYTVTAINSCGTSTDVVNVTVYNAPPAYAGTDIQGCAGDLFQLNATGGGTYSWSPSVGFTCTTCPNPQVVLSSSMGYQVTVTDANGCTATDGVAVLVDAKPTLATTASYKLGCEGLNATYFNLSTGGQTYSWDFGDGTSSPDATPPVHFYDDGNKPYTVTLTGVNGTCVVTRSFTTPPLTVSDVLNIPSIFSPNGDNTNDCLEITPGVLGSSEFLDCGEIVIYDRWGLKVFENTLKNCWNGRKNNSGKVLSAGTYYYVIKFKGTEVKGFVSLMD